MIIILWFIRGGIIFIFMKKHALKENSFDGAPGGQNGTVNYQTPLNTHDSPNTVQDPSKFNTNTDVNKALGPNSNTAKDVPSPEKMEKDVDQIYSKKVIPTADEVKAGLDYELQNMIKPDRLKAKEIVLTNLKRDPKYYGELHHLNIDDKSMNVSLTETLKKINVEETKKIFSELSEKKNKKFVVNKEIAEAMKETIEKYKMRRPWQKGDPTF